VIKTRRLELRPLEVTDAAEMFTVLSDPSLYDFTGGIPPTRAGLEARYRAQVAGPPDGDQQWHNWIIRLTETHAAVGFVQATVTDQTADIAWVVGVKWQGRGIATESASAMCHWLAGVGVKRLVAHIHPDNRASAGVAASLGLRISGEVDDDGEMIWDKRVEA
jgi:RimJ/RimL family protein N-acetyltransferase